MDERLTTRQTSKGLGSGFWRCWTAAVASNVGDGVVLAALPLLVIELTRDPVAVAAVTIAMRLPWLLFGLFAGMIVDRVDRLRLMIATDAVRALLFAGLAALIVTDHLNLTVLYIAVFVSGTLETLFDTASMSITPALVRTDQLEQANGRINSAQILTNEFLGPPLGALLSGVAIAAPFGIDAVTFAISAAVLLAVRGTFRPMRAAQASIIEDMRIGISFVWNEPLIRAFAVGAGTINLGFACAASVLVLHARDGLGLSDVGFGALLVAAAAGGVAGALTASRVIGRADRRASAVWSVIGLCGGVFLTGVAPGFALACAGLALLGFAGEVWNVVSMTYRQTVTPDELLGRVMGAFRVIAYGAFPVGALLGGLVASATSVRVAFLFGALIIAALVPYLLVVTRRHPIAPAAPAGPAVAAR